MPSLKRSMPQRTVIHTKTSILISNDSPVSLCASVDAAWQRRGSGRSYNSLSGHSSLIGEKTGKVLNYTTRKKSCRFCDTAERNGTKPREHDCRKNWQGSSKSMEPNMAIDMIKGKPVILFKLVQYQAT